MASNHKTADILVDNIGNVLDEANKVYNDEGTELHGRAATQHAKTGERAEPETTAERNAAAREAAERWALEHPEGIESPSINLDEPLPFADPGVDASTIQAPGVVYDKYTGKTWTLPTDAMADMSPLLHHSPYNIKKDPNFHYEFHRLEEFNSMLSQQYVPVTCEELGVHGNMKLPGQAASALDRYYIVEGSDICMKIPKSMGEARIKALSNFSSTAVQGTQRGQITMGAADPKSTRDRDTPSCLPLNDHYVPVRGNTNIRVDRHEPTRDETI